MRNNSKSLTCVGTGFIVLDLIRQALERNTTIERRYAGGSCGNVLAILSYLGVHSQAIGRIGDDAAGKELLADLRHWKVDVSRLVSEANRRTPMVIQEIFVDARGRSRHRFSRECPVCGATMPAYRPLLISEVKELAKALPSHGLFFFDRVSPGNLELARHSREQGALIVFEPSGIKDEKLFVECVNTAHVFKYSHERLDGIESLTKRTSVPLEIETRGEEGLRFRIRKASRTNAWHALSAIKAPKVVDTVGSGDWCTAGLLASVAAEPDPIEALQDAETTSKCLRYGQALAALNCGYEGARGLMYSATRAVATKAVERLLADGIAALPKASPMAASNQSCVVCTATAHA
jgi:fructokinase